MCCMVNRPSRGVRRLTFLIKRIRLQDESSESRREADVLHGESSESQSEAADVSEINNTIAR